MRILKTFERFKPSRAQLLSGALILSAAMLAYAVPNVFAPNTPISAMQMNDNFTALETNPSITGNITLVPSTATTGNILKGSERFLHNYGANGNADNNTFLGLNAGNFTMTGYYNTASGVSALTSNTTGNLNTASGVSALTSNTTGHYNTASGVNALFNNTTGSSNTASGQVALRSNTTGNANSASGTAALYDNTTGQNNTASGMSALFNNTTGGGNIALGYQAGYNLTTGNNNIAIGNVGVAAEAATTRIGTAQTRAFIAGIRNVTTGFVDAIPVLIDINGQLGTASSSRRTKDDIADMGGSSEVLMKLRPVTFHYKSDRSPKGRALQYGLVAEEVAKVAPTLVAHTAKGDIETVYYQYLAPMLVNEYQKQQRTIATQAQEIADLKQQMARMLAVLSRLQQPEQVAAAE